MEFQGKICKLCLVKCERFKPVDENMKNVLDVLLLKIDFTITRHNPVMCESCAEMLIKCFDFKTRCLRTLDYIIPFVNKKENIKLDLKDVYLNTDVTGTDVSEDQDICVFCMGLVEQCPTLSFDVKGDVMFKKMIEQFLPEIELSIFKKPIICAPCRGSLENCFRFVTNCLNVKKKTKKYHETLDVDDKSRIELSSLLPFTMSDQTTNEVGGNSIDKIKVEEQFCDDEIEIANGGTLIKLEKKFFDDSEDVKKGDIENDNFTKIDQKLNDEHQVMPKDMLACDEESNKLGSIKKEEIFCEDTKTKEKEENFVEGEDHKFLHQEEIEIKTDEHESTGFEDGAVLPSVEVTTKLRGRRKRSMSNLEAVLSKSCIKHTKHKSILNRHLPKCKDPLNVTVYKCDSCSFQTKHNRGFKKHLLKHKDPLDVTVYKCESCSFQTKHNGGFKKHLLMHRAHLKITMYKCDSCSFQTRYKTSLKRHLIFHKDPSELTMYKCASCLYQTKYKDALKEHLLKHRDLKEPSEVTMYKCDSCSYQTEHSKGLKKHSLVHMDPLNVTQYKCDFCSFETKYNQCLKSHLLVHKDPSEVTMYKCDSCSFETKYSRCLKKHLLLHKDPLEVTVYKCDSCSFQTKHKNSLKNHLLIHKDLSELTMYKCDSCSFQTKYKSDLKKHLLRHACCKDPSEVTMYRCDSGSFQTKNKEHLKMHEDPSEETTYNCDSCSFQTKHKSSLKRHVLKH